MGSIDYRAVADEAYVAALTATTSEERERAARVEVAARAGRADLADPWTAGLVVGVRFMARVRADFLKEHNQ